MPIEAKDGTFSLIRIVDRITHTAAGPEAPAEMPPFEYALYLVLMLKSGEAKGSYELKIITELPSGETEEPMTVSVHFDGEDMGANITARLTPIFRIKGLYWFKVYLEDEFLTALPLRVLYSRILGGR